MKHQPRSGKWLMVVAIAAVMATASACAGSSPGKPASGGSAGGVTSSGGAVQPMKSAQLGTAANAGAADAPAASAETGGTSAQDSGNAPLPSLLDRKIIMTATIDLNVQDVARGFEDVSNIATGAGGFVASSSFGHDNGRETASVTIRVPSDKYQNTLDRVRKLGDVRDTQSSTNDVTEQYTDLQSRLRNLKATEDQYLTLLGRATNIGDILQVQDRLNGVQANIEQVQGRINLMNNQTDLATITVHLDLPPVSNAKPSTGAHGPLEVAADAFQASLAVLRGIATVGLAVAAFSWWLVPLALIGWLLGRRQLRARAP